MFANLRIVQKLATPKLFIQNFLARLIISTAGAGSLLFLQFSLPQISDQNFSNSSLFPNLLSSSALASTRRITYIPPNYGSPRRTTSNASRGCEDLSNLSLYLLAPKDHVGVTASDRPTFSWYISNIPNVPVEFVLVEEGVPTPLWKQKMEVQKVGITTISLPKDAPQLLVGREYKWSVRLICNPVSPSASPLYISWIRKVPLEKGLRSQLSSATSDRDRASLYAQAGIWYEAVTMTVNQVNDRTLPQAEVMTELRSLLTQAGLPSLANHKDTK
jgi:hypothetical protein